MAKTSTTGKDSAEKGAKENQTSAGAEELAREHTAEHWPTDDGRRTQVFGLGDTRLQSVQRQKLAARLGRTAGNEQLQRTVSSIKRAAEPLQSSSEIRHDEGAAGERVQTDRLMTGARGNQAEAALSKLPNRGATIVQRSITGRLPTLHGEFEMDMITKQDGLTGGKSGLSGTIKFHPSKKAPYSNKIGLIQIVKLTDAGGKNIDPASMPATHGPHLRTGKDKAKGVEEGYFTDVLHQDFSKPPKVKGPGSELLPYYPFAPTVGPSARKAGDIFGFKRSEKASDIKEAVLFDFPGAGGKTWNLDFAFETVAKGDDNRTVYGGVKWSFGLRAGKVVNENKSVADVGSATFEAALEKHRDFYVHEPVTFYFGFDQDQADATELAKIDSFLAYLTRFPDVRLELTGYTDLRGSADYNRDLARRRSNSIAQTLLRRGVDASRITLNPPVGITTEFTSDVKAPGEQQREALRRANRRVALRFVHTASISPK